MRIFMIILIAIGMMATVGCGGGKSSGKTPEDAVRKARERQLARQNNPDAQNPNEGTRVGGMAPGGKKAGSNNDSDEFGDVTGGEGDEAGDSEGEGDDLEDGEDAAAPPVENKGVRRTGALRKKKVSTPQLGGNPMAGKNKKKKKAPEKKKREQPRDDKNDDDGAMLAEEGPVETFVSFYDRAVRAFARNHDPEAFQYLYAHYLVDEGALDQYPLGWYDGINEPRVGLRWGIAINYSPGSFEGDPPVIGGSDSGSGSNEDRRGQVSNSGGGMGLQGGTRRKRTSASKRIRSNPGNSKRGGSATGSDDERTPLENLQYYTGDFGDAFIRRYEMRRQHNDAFYGNVMSSINVDSVDLSDEGAAGAGGVRGGLGLGGGRPPRQNTRDPNDNSGGMGFMDGDNPPQQQQPNNASRRQSPRQSNNRGAVEAEYDAEESSLAPGLMYLGRGNRADMMATAKAYELDMLVMFDVKVKHSERSNGDTSTKSNIKVQVYSVKAKEAKPLNPKARSLSNLQVESAREKGRDDPVEAELDAIFRDMADKDYKAGVFPDIDSEKFVLRYEYLLKSEYENPLPVLVEIKMYRDDGHISQNDYIAACQQLLGNLAAQDLIDGEPVQQEAALKKYLPGQFKVQKTGGDDGFR